MPSTYTLNNGIELIATGEQSGTWGDTTNTNMSLLDTALDGQVTVTLASAGTSGSPNTLPISDGAASNGRNRLVIFNDGADLGGTAYVQLTPNDAEKIVYIRNALSGSRSIIVFQGTYNASNDYEIPAGTTAVIFFNGGGTGAVAANVFNNAHFDALNIVGAAAVGTTLTVGTSLNIASSTTVDGVLDEDNMASDSATKLATQQSIKAYVDSQVTAQDLDFAGDSGTGAVDLDSQTFTIAGTANEIETSASGQTLTVGLPDNVTIAGDLTVDTNTLFVDSSTNKVSIGTTSSDGTLHVHTGSAGVVTAAAAADDLVIENSNAAGLSLLFDDTSTNSYGVIYWGNETDGNADGRIEYFGSTYVTAADRQAMLFRTGAVERLRLQGTAVVINETGTDTDFRVESDTNTHALFVDAGNNRVGVLTSSPATALDVAGTITADGLTVENDSESMSTFYRPNSSAAAAFNINFDFNTANGTQETFAQLRADNDGNTDGAQDGALSIRTAKSGSLLTRFKADENGDISFYEDTGTTAKLTWDASAERLVLKTSGAYALDVQASGTTSVTMAQFSNSAGSDKAYIALDSTGAGKLVLLDGGNNEDVLIQANSHSYYNTGGNFYFGKASGDLSTDGVEARAVGLLGATRTSNPPLVLRRNTDNGDIITLSKDTTEIGSLGSNSGGLFIADDDTGLFFNRASNNILPYRNDSGNEGPYTNALDLGRSTARFKDAYLRSVDITHDSDRGRIRLYANASLSGEMRIFNANGYGLISMIDNHTLNFHTNSVERLELGSGEAVFNDVSADVDFRVESNNYAQMLLVDAGNDRVQFGSSYTSTKTGIVEVVQTNNNSSSGFSVLGTSAATSARMYTLDNVFKIARGSIGSAINIDSSNNIILNEQGDDQDFRVESDSNANMLFVDAGNNRVGINEATPVAALSVAGDILRRTYNGMNSNTIIGTADADSNWYNVGNQGDVYIQAMSSYGSGAYQQSGGNIYIKAGTPFSNNASGGYVTLQSRANAAVGTTRPHVLIKHETTSVAEFDDREVTINEDSNDIDFRVESDSNTHALFVDAGNDAVLVGGTSITADEGGIALIPQASNVSHMYIGHATGTAGGNPYIYFRYGSGNIGSIAQSGTTAVQYNTSSDQRLKDNIVDAPSASDDIDAIQVRSFDWKADGSHQKYGMVAQELQSVAPEAVSGNADSDDMMGVDYSKLVPMLVKEIQSLRARVAQLESN